MNEIEIISPILAQTIVDAAKDVIGKEINFMDLHGNIIASTDKSRVGTIHTAATMVIKKKDIIEINVEQAFPGAKKGINYPITVEQRLIGVIGITGNPEECRSLGFLLMKICEVFIKEQMLLRQTTKTDELRSSVVRMLLFEKITTEKALQISSKQLAYPLEGKAYVGIIQMNESDMQSQVQKLLFSSNIKLFTYLFPNQYAFIANQSTYKNIIDKIHTSFSEWDVYIAIGDITKVDSLGESYQNAKMALQYAISHHQRIGESNILQFEMLLQTVDSTSKDAFLNKIVGRLVEDEKQLLKTYYEHNLSLKETAEILFIHKNTLQYRLEKIKEKTNLDPRNFHDTIQLYVALLLQTE